MENHPDEEILNPRFFQFIVAQRMTKELQIPKTFERHMEGKTSGIVSLKAPSTNIWPVNLVEKDQGLFLQDGWERFILDKSTCSKEDAIYVKPSRGGKGTIGDSRRAKQKPEREIPRCATPITRDNKGRALREAMTFRTERPSATVVMKMSQIKKGFSLRLPAAFCESSLPKVTQTMTLNDPSGRAWQINYICSVVHGYTSGLLSAGWKAFAICNDLQVDDVCVFEVIEHSKMQVHIFRG